MTQEKYCRKCEILVDIDSFPKDHRNKDGHSSWCKKCHYYATRKWLLKKQEDQDYRSVANQKYRERYARKRSAKWRSIRCINCGSDIADRNDLFRSKYCLACRTLISRDIQRKCYIKNGHRYRANFKLRHPGYDKDRQRRNVQALSPTYIKKLLIHNTGFRKEDLVQHPEIISTKEIILKINRLWKTSQSLERHC
jgi:hypothetical protein